MFLKCFSKNAKAQTLEAASAPILPGDVKPTAEELETMLKTASK